MSDKADTIDGLSKSLLNEFAFFMIGERLGSGCAREVFQHPFDPTKVIKVENKVGSFQNIREWDFWCEWSHDKQFSKWLAPCHAISHSGTFLIQSKAIDIQPHQVPKLLPIWITDHKIENLGMIGNKVVVRDYGFIRQTLDTKLRKWRNYL